MGRRKEKTGDGRGQEVVVEYLDTAVYVCVRVEKGEILYRLFRKIDNALGKITVDFYALLGVEDRSVQPDANLSHELACDSFQPEVRPT